MCDFTTVAKMSQSSAVRTVLVRIFFWWEMDIARDERQAGLSKMLAGMISNVGWRTDRVG
jgi:hypothetical protein